MNAVSKEFDGQTPYSAMTLSLASRRLRRARPAQWERRILDGRDGPGAAGAAGTRGGRAPNGKSLGPSQALVLVLCLHVGCRVGGLPKRLAGRSPVWVAAALRLRSTAESGLVARRGSLGGWIPGTVKSRGLRCEPERSSKDPLPFEGRIETDRTYNAFPFEGRVEIVLVLVLSRPRRECKHQNELFGIQWLSSTDPFAPCRLPI